MILDVAENRNLLSRPMFAQIVIKNLKFCCTKNSKTFFFLQKQKFKLQDDNSQKKTWFKSKIFAL